MAQEKEVKEKPKRTRKTQKSAKEKPYVEQINELLFVHNKEDPKAGVQAVSEIDGEGKVRTVPAEEKNENSFLKFEKNSSILENFIRNFWSQLKDPTRFGILSIKEDTLDDPKVRQAVEDLAAGKKTDAVEEFLKQYEIVPRDKENQSINHQNQEEMAKKNETQQQAAQGDGTQQPKYRYNESMINWEQLKNFGLSREELQERGLLDQMLRGYKTNQVVPISMNFGSAVLRTDARLSFQQSRSGDIVLGIHGIRQKPDLDRPYFGHIFSDEDKKNLLERASLFFQLQILSRHLISKTADRMSVTHTGYGRINVFRLDDSVLVSLAYDRFLRYDEAGSHLDRLCAQHKCRRNAASICDTSGCNHRNRNTLCNLSCQFQIITCLGSVTVHTGQEDFPGTQRFYLLCPFYGINPHVDPATVFINVPATSVFPSFGIDCHNHTLTAKLIRSVADKPRCVYGT